MSCAGYNSYTEGCTWHVPGITVIQRAVHAPGITVIHRAVLVMRRV